MSRPKLRLPAIGSVPDAGRALREIEAHLNFVPAVSDTRPTSGIKFLAQDSEGHWELYDLVAGTNITLTLDEVAQTLTIDAAGGGGGSLDDVLAVEAML